MNWLAILMAIIALAIFFRMRASVHRQREQDIFDDARSKRDVPRMPPCEECGLSRDKCKTCQQGGSQ